MRQVPCCWGSHYQVPPPEMQRHPTGSDAPAESPFNDSRFPLEAAMRSLLQATRHSGGTARHPQENHWPSARTAEGSGSDIAVA